MRLKLVRSETNFDFFSKLRLWVGLSLVLLILSLGSVLTQGLNFGIDFLGLWCQMQQRGHKRLLHDTPLFFLHS
ncbi:MAG: hypothetical protein ACPHI0_02670, partial [Paracoccaceae bacterium]